MTQDQELKQLEAELALLKAKMKGQGLEVPQVRRLIAPKMTSQGLKIPEGCTGEQLSRYFNALKRNNGKLLH